MGRAHEVRAASMAKTAAAKAKLNSKWSRLIYMAAKGGVPDPDLNQTLKRTIERAKREQVTADVIKRAIDKAKGADQTSYAELLLEGFGPGNSQVVVECLTDNHNRTQTDVKVAFQKTYDAVIAILSDDAKEYLTHVYGDLTVFITNMIEAEVNRNKG